MSSSHHVLSVDFEKVCQHCIVKCKIFLRKSFIYKVFPHVRKLKNYFGKIEQPLEKHKFVLTITAVFVLYPKTINKNLKGKKKSKTISKNYLRSEAKLCILRFVSGFHKWTKKRFIVGPLILLFVVDVLCCFVFLGRRQQQNFGMCNKICGIRNNFWSPFTFAESALKMVYGIQEHTDTKLSYPAHSLAS